MNTELKLSAKLIRAKLASIDFENIDRLEKEKMSEIELKSRAGDVETFYTSHLEKILKLFIYEQLKFIGSEAVNDLQLQFGRGTINGLTLIDEWCKKQKIISLSRFDKDEEFPTEI